MLDVKSIDLHYGAAPRAAQRLASRPRPARSPACWAATASARPACLRALVGQHPISQGSIALDGADITVLRPEQRARRGIAYCPQGREIFPLLSVEENLKTGLRAAAARSSAPSPMMCSSCFRCCKDMLRRRGGDLSGGQQQQLAIGRALVMRPRVLLLDEPTEGIQPSIIKDIGRAIAYLRDLGQMAIVLVEQYLDFARELGDTFAVMDRGAVVYATSRADMDEAELRRCMAL